MPHHAPRPTAVTGRVLVRHPSDAVQSTVRAVTARTQLTPTTARFEYRVTGDIGALAIPGRADPRQADRLWEHTCFEAFIAPLPGSAYYELNFSPSTEWAAYAFAGYRLGMRPLALAPPPSIAVDEARGELRVTASVEIGALPAAPWPWRIALTAIVEDRAGGRAFYALEHPRERPDFHDAAGFVLMLDGNER
jgi:hypothetical protein